MFVCFLEFIVPLENFSLIWRRHHCRRRAANFALCSALMAIEQWGFLTCRTHCDTGLPFIMFISDDPWHSHLLLSVRQWSCHYLFLRLRSVATGDWIPISRMRGERSISMPPRRSYEIKNPQYHTYHNIPIFQMANSRKYKLNMCITLKYAPHSN